MESPRQPDTSPRKRWLWPLMVVALCGIGIGVLLARSQRSVGDAGAGDARLAVDREVIDFGRVPMDRYVEATFVLTNVGTDTLRMARAPWVQVVQGC